METGDGDSGGVRGDAGHGEVGGGQLPGADGPGDGPAGAGSWRYQRVLCTLKLWDWRTVQHEAAVVLIQCAAVQAFMWHAGGAPGSAWFTLGLSAACFSVLAWVRR
jgi:hypothetical protein